MLANRKMNFIGQLFIFLATFFWGTSFIVLKETIEEVPSFYVIAIRFIVAGGILSLIFVKKLKNGGKSAFIKGAILGLLLFSAYFTQTLGLERTTAGRNAFITSSHCVMCPFIVWILYKKKPKIVNLVSAVLCIIGLALVSLSGDDAVGENLFLGDALTLAGALFFALQIIAIDKFQKDGEDSVSVLCYELLTVGVLFVVLTLSFDLPTLGARAYALTLDQIIKIGYLCLVCTLFTQFAQMFGQKFTTPNQTSIILTFEAVFGVVFAVILGGEKLTTTLVVGFVVIFISVLISEVDVDYSKLFKKKSVGNVGDNDRKDNGEVCDDES